MGSIKYKKKHDIQKGKNGAILVVHSSRGFISYHSWLKFGLFLNKFLMIKMVQVDGSTSDPAALPYCWNQTCGTQGSLENFYFF